jgi:predicted esterase
MSEPTYRTLVVERHARVGVVGDIASATEAWIILHGYGMRAQGILHWFRSAARPGRVLIAPEALSRFYTESRGIRHVGASWMTREAREDDLSDIMAYLDRVALDIVGPRTRIEVHGFSQGGAAAARWVAREGRVVDRLVFWGCVAPPDVAPERLLPAVREGRLHYVIGRRDVRVAPADVISDAARLRAAGTPVTVHEFDGGHRIDDGVLQLLGHGA